MRFDIVHQTDYHYSSPVFLEPQLLRLRPRTDWSQRLAAYDLEISPRPAGRAKLVDLDGNDTVQLWFSDTHDHLRITARSTVETLREDPFAYLLDTEADRLPPPYAEQSAQLQVYQTHDTDPAVQELTRAVQREAGDLTVHFLSLLNQRIKQICPTETRLEGDPLTPAQTLARGGGACRDVAILFMASCRSLGLAARFTSGYVEGSLQQERFLHAWAEIYLPGAGWCGYDPSLGLVVADRHVALASGPTAAATRPFSGRFRGDNTQAAMTVDLQIHTTPST
jgi:transglutaminase-like putative cysteine protease